MTGENAKRIKDVLIGILVIIGVLAVLPALLTLIMTVFSGLITGFSFAYIAIVEMMKYWSVNIWTSFFYLGLLIAEIGLLIIIIPLIIWAVKWLIKAVTWVISVIKQRLGGKQ
ncbi:hypothetical protein [Limosilactobacillus agrestimuris]|uniref:hypothetical protein n=1 Tax=Limosilactobacillus agrestimuris TaxID=2941331 RepID=UPI00203D8D46|nr:hypothetical protein [Limosilactobacillus agrestimuris]